MDVFGVVVIVVSVAAAVVAALSYVRANRLFQQIGRMGALWIDERDRMSFEDYEAIEEEMRQTLEAISAEREARGEAPLDINPRLRTVIHGDAHDPGDREATSNASRSDAGVTSKR
jgi:hypothetical protein